MFSFMVRIESHNHAVIFAISCEARDSVGQLVKSSGKSGLVSRSSDAGGNSASRY